MEIAKVAIIGIAGTVVALMLRQEKSEYAQMISIGLTVLIAAYAFAKVNYVTQELSSLFGEVPIDETYIRILFKLTGITYLSEFASSVCKDAGYGAVAAQIEIFAKISLVLVSFPIILALIETIRGL